MLFEALLDLPQAGPEILGEISHSLLHILKLSSDDHTIMLLAHESEREVGVLHFELEDGLLD